LKRRRGWRACAIVDHERLALVELDDDRLDGVVRAMEELEAAIVIALNLLDQPAEDGRSGYDCGVLEQRRGQS
jgi:hypothetical protein